MKSFEIKALGLEEMSKQEMVKVDGGFPWWIIHALLHCVSGDTPIKEEDIDEEEYYGGELDSAYCIAER